MISGCGTSSEVNRLLQESKTRINAESVQSVQVQSGLGAGTVRRGRCAAQTDMKVDLQSFDFSSLRCADASQPVMETFRMSHEQTKGVKKALGSLAVRRFVDGPLTFCPEGPVSGSETDRVEIVHVSGKKEVYVSLAALQGARPAAPKLKGVPENGADERGHDCHSAHTVHGVFVDEDAEGLVTALRLE